MDTNTTRRSLLRRGTGALAYSAGAAVVTGGLLVSGEAKGAAPSADSVNPRLTRAIALRAKAAAECDRFDEEIEMPARRARQAVEDAYRGEPAPAHREVATTFENVFGDTVGLSTSRIGAAETARRVVNDPSWSDMGDEVWRQAHRGLVDLADERDAIIARQDIERRAFVDQTIANFRIEAIMKRSSQLADREYALRMAIITMPTASLADVLAKIDFRAGADWTDEDDTRLLDAVARDVRRLSGGEG